jgi:hypothetical protein
VNNQRTGASYADLNVAVDIAERLRKSNAPHTITVRRISTGATAWPSSDVTNLAPLQRSRRHENRPDCR